MIVPLGERGTLATITEDADALRRQMAQIRHDMHVDMQGVVAGAEEASDWRHYVKLYPYAALAVAFLAGYIAVPRRRKSTAEVAAATAAKVQEIVGATIPAGAQGFVAQAVAPEPPKPKGKGFLGTVIGLAAPFAWRAVQRYGVSYLENWIAAQQAAIVGAAQPTPPSQPSY